MDQEHNVTYGEHNILRVVKTECYDGQDILQEYRTKNTAMLVYAVAPISNSDGDGWIRWIVI